MHLSLSTTFAPQIFCFAHPIFLTSLRHCIQVMINHLSLPLHMSLPLYLSSPHFLSPYFSLFISVCLSVCLFVCPFVCVSLSLVCINLFRMSLCLAILVWSVCPSVPLSFLVYLCVCVCLSL